MIKLDANKLDIDLREEVSAMISETKYEVLLQRTSKRIRCTCYNETYKEAHGKCPKCLGAGWLFKFEKHKVLKQDAIMSNDNGLIVTNLGFIDHGYATFYFSHEVPISKGDYLWEVSWKKGKPIKLNTLYKIKEASEQRGETGKIEFKVGIAAKEVIDKDFRNMHIGKAWREI